MDSVKGSKTEKNILTAFAGESQARNRYTYFSKQAKKEGFVQIADIFEETANQEKEHAKRFFKFLEGGELEITESFLSCLESLEAKYQTAFVLRHQEGLSYDDIAEALDMPRTHQGRERPERKYCSDDWEARREKARPRPRVTTA